MTDTNETLQVGDLVIRSRDRGHHVILIIQVRYHGRFEARIRSSIINTDHWFSADVIYNKKEDKLIKAIK